MKKILGFVFIGLLLISPICFAEVVTDCGQVTLTNNQILNYSPSGIWKRFSYVNGEVLGVSDAQPSQGDIDGLVSQLEALPDVTPESVYISNFSFKTLWGTVWAGSVSQVGSVELPPYFPTIEAFWNYPNRSAIYPYMQALVAAGKGTSGDLALIVAAFNDQHIDIVNIQ